MRHVLAGGAVGCGRSLSGRLRRRGRPLSKAEGEFGRGLRTIVFGQRFGQLAGGLNRTPLVHVEPAAIPQGREIAAIRSPSAALNSCSASSHCS